MKGFSHLIYIALFFIVGISSLIILVINGYQYYSLPIEERVFSDLHTSLKPSGTIGHGIGILGSLMMIIGVSSYMIRKRVRFLFHLGFLKNWLEFHIFMCTVGPMFVLFHTAFKFGGIVSISFWSMVVVAASGFIGRFIYLQIPHSIQGQELDVYALNRAETELNEKLQKKFSIDEKILKEIEQVTKTEKYLRTSALKSFFIVIQDYRKIIRILRNLKHHLHSDLKLEKSKTKEILKTAKAKMILSRRIGMLRTMQKLFNYWHIFHLPFALSMFIIMIIHIAVALTFGYKWIF